MHFLRVLVLTAVLSAPLGAQQWSDLLSRGQRVRVAATNAREPVQGAYEGLLADTVRMSPERRFYERHTQLAIATTNLRTLDVSDGKARLKWGVGGVVVGGVVGLVVGRAIGAQFDAQCTSYADRQPGQCYYLSSEEGMVAAILGAVGGGVGAVLGGVVGTVGAPEKWRRIYSAGDDHR